jgi:outer membrane protein TolC
MKRLFLFLIPVFGQMSAQAQTVLTKTEAVRLAMDGSRKVEMADNNIKTAEAKFKQTDAVFLPQLSLEYSAMTTNNPLNAFAFKLQQRSITQNDFNPDLLNHPGGTGNFATQAMLLQPIYNADMLAMRQAARKQIAIAGYQKQRTQEYLKFSAETEYSLLQFSYERASVAREALATLQAIYKQTQDRYNQGYMQKSDLLNVDVHVKSAETQIAAAQTAIQEHCDNLSALMGKPLGTVYQVDSLQQENTDAGNNTVPANRSDFKAMETAIASYNDMMKSTKRGMIPKLNGFAAYQLNDNRALGFGNGAYLAGIQLTWNIFKGNEVHTKLATQQSEQKQLNLQLKDSREEDTKALAKATNQLKEADYQLAQYGAAVEQAKEALLILNNRYQQGLVSSTDILQAQTQLSQQKLFYQQAVLLHNSTLAYIRFLTAQ